MSTFCDKLATRVILLEKKRLINNFTILMKKKVAEGNLDRL